MASAAIGFWYIPLTSSMNRFEQASPEAIAAQSEATLALLQRARLGDRQAIDALTARYLPRLTRWANGRLPPWARDLDDTDDLVQDALMRTFARIDQIEVRGEGALQAYLRQVIYNRIRDEIRRAQSRPAPSEIDTELPDERAASPFEHAVGTEMAERYETALATLSEIDREAIIARVELGGTYAEVAVALAKPSPEAARIAVGRALVKLAEAMGRGR